jgi:hypothetical protein
METQINITQALEKLSTQIECLKKQNLATQFKSDDLKELFMALSKAQGEMNIAGLNKQNPYFKSRYADLTSVVMASRAALFKNGLSVMQQIMTNEDGASILHTILGHGSGQFIESRVRIVPPKNDIQSVSSYTTYLKRMCYASLIGVVTGDEDDDGEAAVATERDTMAKGVALNNKYNAREESYEPITKEQLDDLEYELQEHPDIAQQVMDGLKIQSIADIPKSKFNIAIRRVREIKNMRNGIK